MLDTGAVSPTAWTSEAGSDHPPLVLIPSNSADPPPYVHLFAEMLAPLARNFNLLPDAHLRLISEELGESPPLGAPALVDIMVDMAPSMDQVVVLPPGTAFATSSSESDTPVTFCALAECRLESASLITAGALPTTTSGKDTALAAQFVPVTPNQSVGVEHCVLFVLSRPIPGMTCLVTLPTDVPDSTKLRWEAWQGGEWVACGSQNGAGLSAAPRSAEFAVPIPAAHSPCTFPATGKNPPVTEAGLLRCTAPSAFTLLGETGVRCRGTVTAVQGELVRDEVLGYSDGTPAQRFPLLERISTAYLRPWVESFRDTSVERWTMVDSFASSGPLDRHFMVNAATSRIVFSPDTQRGGVPPAGAALRIALYHSGGGATGNVPSRSVSILKTPRPEITAVFNPRAATGGTDPRAIDRRYAMSHRPVLLAGAAATARECEDLALSSGLGVARALCTPSRGYVQMPAVNLHVLPTARPDSLGRLAKDQLTTSRDTKDAIRRGLGPHLPAGADVTVTDFPLQDIITTVTVRARQWASPQERWALARDACTALYRYFSPLPGKGPLGEGWPIGQKAGPSDVYRALADVPNLDSVSHAALEGPPTVSPDSLIYSIRHTVSCTTFEGQIDPEATFRG
ncbi:putative baseplate assembly protein [Streptomyces wuyuanensis]|uniref:putative baseplate assembly protein n=1 Tax=Streptomyces wuyuanensis TaxID=1196353 RepID=UPI00342332FB